MTFTLHITTDSKCKDIKEKCCEVLAEFLKKEGYFSVEFDPSEIDIDKLGKACPNISMITCTVPKSNAN